MKLITLTNKQVKYLLFVINSDVETLQNSDWEIWDLEAIDILTAQQLIRKLS